MRALLVAVLLAALPAHAGLVMRGSGGAAPSGCTGNLLVYAPFENDAADYTTGGGCTDSAATKAISGAGTVFNAVTFVDGSYAIENNGFNDYAYITPDASIDVTEKGSVSGWVKRTNASYAGNLLYIRIDATHYIFVQATATNTTSINYNDGSGAGNLVHSTTCAYDTTGAYLRAAWDFSQGAGSDWVKVVCCDDAACSGETITEGLGRTVSDIGDVASALYGVGGQPITGQTHHSIVDALRIYTSTDWTE